MSDQEKTPTGPWVLVVEDDVDIVDLYNYFLAKNNYRVIATGKLSEAMTKVKNQTFQCILLDMKIEQGSGEAVAEYVRSDVNGYNYSTPVIVVSGHLNALKVQRLAKLVDGALVKPFTEEMLIARITSAIAARKKR